VFPRALIVRLSNVPRVGGCHLLMFDTSGEAFRDVTGVMTYGRYVKRSPAVIWLVSLTDLSSPAELDDFLTIYLQAQAEMAGAPDKQELIVALTKGDLLLAGGELPDSAARFLREHRLDPRGDSWVQLEQVSADLERWLQQSGHHNFVNHARDSFASVHYCIMSAQGAADTGGTLDLRLMPRGVTAPLFWLWRRLAPPVWVEHDGQRELYFGLDEAVRDAPAGATIHLGSAVYRTKAPLQVRRSLKFVGRGITKTCIRSSGDGYVLAFGAAGAKLEASDLIFHHDGSMPADVVRVVKGEAAFHRCGFVGGFADPGKIDGDGLVMAKDTNGSILECEFTRNHGNGVSLRDAVQARVEGGAFRQNRGSGISCLSSGPCVILKNVCTGNESHGIRLGGNAAARVAGNTCQANKRSGITCGDSARGEIRDNSCVENGLNGIYVMKEASPLLEGNRCLRNQASGIGFTDSATGIVRGNRCHENAHCGISVTDVSAPELRGNECEGNAKHGIGIASGSTGIVNGNQCRNNHQCGIFLENNVAAVVEDNVCIGNLSHGIEVAPSAGRIRLRANQCRDNGGLPIRDQRRRGWFG
jgi:parallel beta-helix repeat protein